MANPYMGTYYCAPTQPPQLHYGTPMPTSFPAPPPPPSPAHGVFASHDATGAPQWFQAPVPPRSQPPLVTHGSNNGLQQWFQPPPLPPPQVPFPSHDVNNGPPQWFHTQTAPFRQPPPTSTTPPGSTSTPDARAFPIDPALEEDTPESRSPSPTPLCDISVQRAQALLEKARTRLNTSKTRRKRANNLTPEQRAAAELAKKEKWNNMIGKIKEELDRQRNNASEIAAEFDVPVDRVRTESMRLTNYKKQRPATEWNAYQKIKSLDINSHLPQGEKLTLHEIHAIKSDDKSGYHAFLSNKAVKDIGMQLLLEEREKKMTGSRSSTMAIAQDIGFVGGRICDELKNLGDRSNTSALLIIVRTSPLGTHQPIIFYDDLSKRFVEEGLNTPIEHLPVDFEAFAMAGMKGYAKKKAQSSRDARRIAGKAAARLKINKGLNEIVGRNVSMRWKHYEKSIVKKYNVRLVGWPFSLPFDIEKLRESELRALNDALDDGTCYWEELSLGDLETRATEGAKVTTDLSRPRKTRSDAGKRRDQQHDVHVAMKRPRVTSNVVVEDSGDISDDQSASSSASNASESDTDENCDFDIYHDSNNDEESENNSDKENNIDGIQLKSF